MWFQTWVFFALGTRPTSEVAQCLDAPDMRVWNATAHHNFTTFMEDCSRQCWGAASCVADCVHRTQNLSSPCSACFGNLAACTVKNCMSPCVQGGSASGACRACEQQYCGDPFARCSGLDLPCGRVRGRVTASICAGTPGR